MAIEIWQKKCLPLSPWTHSHTIWLIKHSFLCSLISAGINFSVCILTFKGEDDPTLWYFPTPIAGSLAVTLGLELGLNWIINNSVMTGDVIHGKIAAIQPIQFQKWWPKSDHFLRWWLNGSELVISPNCIPSLSFFQRIMNHTYRAFPWGIFAFIITWPISVFICWIFWGNNGYNDFPLPQAIIAVYGMFLALVTVPLWGVMILADLGERLSDFSSDNLSLALKIDQDRLDHHT
jgi:hypothetical protein